MIFWINERGRTVATDRANDLRAFKGFIEDYRIQPSAQAETDINRIFNCLSERSPDGAARWYESFWDATERLQ
jgi:hypothetical protein